MVNIIKGQCCSVHCKKIPIIVHTNLIIVEAKQCLNSKYTVQSEMLPNVMLPSAISLYILLIKNKSKKHWPPGLWGLPSSEPSTICSPHSRRSCLGRLTRCSCPLQLLLRRCPTPMLVSCPRNNPQVAGDIRAENTHTTHANTMEPISFWCSKLGCIFWLYSSVYIDLLHGK
jgi:hypothetical protein